MKTCSACGASKPLSEYARADTCVDGTRSYCKACHKLRKDAWRANNRERHNAKGKAWAQANPEKRKAVVAASTAKRTAEGKVLAAKRQWVAANPERARAAVSARRRKLRAAMPPWVDLGAIRAIYNRAALLGLTVDHIIPLRHPLVSGLHVPWNLQLLTRSDNSRKGNMFGG